MPSDRELLVHLYDRFNARDIEAVLATMHQESFSVVTITSWPLNWATVLGAN
jgi:hypothetical protein